MNIFPAIIDLAAGLWHVATITWPFFVAFGVIAMVLVERYGYPFNIPHRRIVIADSNGRIVFDRDPVTGRLFSLWSADTFIAEVAKQNKGWWATTEAAAKNYAANQTEQITAW